MNVHKSVSVLIFGDQRISNSLGHVHTRITFSWKSYHGQVALL